MKINLSLFILTLSAFTGSFVSADLNSLVTSYGVQNSSIEAAGLNEALNLLRAAGGYNDDADARALSAILRAQLSNDTTQADLGNNAKFATLFPVYTTEAANAFKSLVSASSTPESRRAAMQDIALIKWLPGIIRGNGGSNSGVLATDKAQTLPNGNTILAQAALHQSRGWESDVIDDVLSSLSRS